MWHKQLQQHWNKTKSFLHQGYRNLGKWAGHVERAAGIGRKVFSTIVPILDDLGQGDAVKQGMKVFQGYDQVRGQIMDIDDSIRRHASRIGSADLFS